MKPKYLIFLLVYTCSTYGACSEPGQFVPRQWGQGCKALVGTDLPWVNNPMSYCSNTTEENITDCFTALFNTAVFLSIAFCLQAVVSTQLENPVS